MVTNSGEIIRNTEEAIEDLLRKPILPNDNG